MGSFRKRHPALIAIFRDIIENEERDVADILRPCPDLYDITAFQFAVFDNPRGERWGANLKAWTGDKVNFKKKAAWSANVYLWSADQVADKVASLQDVKKRKRPLTKDTGDLLVEIADSGQFDFVGLCHHKNPRDGTFYFEDHMVLVKMEGDWPVSARLFTPSMTFEFPAFDDKGAGWANGAKTARKSLGGNTVAQSRHSFADDMQPWVTGKGVDLSAPADL
jgi:hypothetical protein